MVRRVTGPWNAAALPEIMAGALQESKRDEPETFHEGQAAGQQPGSAAGARGGGAAEARARPNVEVNRRAEGTSELNRRLGDGAKGAAALERCGAAWLLACCSPVWPPSPSAPRLLSCKAPAIISGSAAAFQGPVTLLAIA